MNRRYETGVYLKTQRAQQRKKRKLYGSAAANNRITPEFFGWVYGCAWCGAKGVKLELDHIVPLMEGGAHHVSNTVFSCRRCNASRGATAQGRRDGMRYLRVLPGLKSCG